MQREEKQLEMFLDTSLTKLKDLKNAIGSMIRKIEFEHETINWPQFLDNFALISGHLAGLSKQLSLEYTPQISRLTLLPLHLSPDPDEHLAQLTEGRLNTFAAEYVPDYLRTKHDPIMESRIHLHEAKAAALTNEAATKQVAQFQKIVSHVHDIVQKAHDEWEGESMNRIMQMQTFIPADTQNLVKAVGMGVGLKSMPGGSGLLPSGPRMPGPGGVPMSAVSPNIPQIGKLPSSIKTNIKSASLHPYR